MGKESKNRETPEDGEESPPILRARIRGPTIIICTQLGARKSTLSVLYSARVIAGEQPQRQAERTDERTIRLPTVPDTHTRSTRIIALSLRTLKRIVCSSTAVVFRRTRIIGRIVSPRFFCSSPTPLPLLPCPCPRLVTVIVTHSSSSFFLSRG